jgi:hypothetical protein
MIAIGLGSSGKEVRRDVTARLFLRCEDPWKFSVSRHSGETFTMRLVKRHIFSRNRSIGGCTIPLEWFPMNRAVRDWFPITDGEYVDNENPHNIVLLDVHVASRKARPFSGRYARLQIFPTWKRPIDRDVECPEVPPLILVVREEQPAQEGSRYLTVGIIPSPSAQMHHQIPQPLPLAMVPQAGGWASAQQSRYPTVPIQSIHRPAGPQ